MKAKSKFLGQPKEFWANVRTISQGLGYVVRGSQEIRVPSLKDIQGEYAKLDLSCAHLLSPSGKPTSFGRVLLDYFQYRASVLSRDVRGNLQDADEACRLYEQLKKEYRLTVPPPMNKQKGDKRAVAFFTASINAIIEANIGGLECDYDPRKLTTVTTDMKPLRTLARRIDGAFPSVVNPVAVWEIKEYYYTTTFGSRVADGVYESLLDGMELEELRESEGRHVEHLLMVDGYRTWWKDGRSYLCRIIDMLHMGYVDEVLFGREIAAALPRATRRWAAVARRR